MECASKKTDTSLRTLTFRAIHWYTGDQSHLDNTLKGGMGMTTQETDGSQDGSSRSRYRVATGEINKLVDDILDCPPTRSTVKMSANERESLLRQAIRRTAAVFRPHGGQ